MENHNALGEMIREVAEARMGEVESFSEIEQGLRQQMKALGQSAMVAWLQRLAGADTMKESPCPHCGEQAYYERQRAGKLRTVFGEIPYQRAYYRCRHCHQGHYPLDEQLGLRPNAMSAEVERLAGMMGVQMPFGRGSHIFEELTLISLSDHSLDKASQAYGQASEEQEAAWVEVTQDAEEMRHRQREGRRRIRFYGAIDGGRVQIRGPKGEDQPWRELKVGAWFEAKGRPPTRPDGEWAIQAQHISYYADITTADEFGELFWATGVQRGAQLAHELIILGDGARWIWDLVTTYFPDAIQIVDWFHACEYIAPVAKVAFRDQARRQRWIAEVKQQLWDGKIDQVIAACDQFVDPAREDDPAQKAVTYFSNNGHRMDYPTYRANGYQIGSGTIESGVKQITTQRMKVPGARWNAVPARLVAKARAAFLSDQWVSLASRRRFNRKAA